MLRFDLRLKDGTVATVRNVLTVKLDSELEVPADSLKLSMPFDRNLCDNADFIFAYDEDRLVFRGQVDEADTIVSGDGMILVLVARSLAGAMLDNEAEPVTYINPAARFVFERHAKAFGIDEFDADDVPFGGVLRISKGTTHWQVIRNFCIGCYGCEPRVTGSGRLLFRGAESKRKLRLGKGGIAYTSLKECRLRCKPISEVKLKLSEFGTYNSSIKNSNPECEYEQRVRYVDTTADNTSIQTADNMVKNSNQSSYSLRLECVGCLTDLIGCGAEVFDEVLGQISDLRVVKACTTLNRSGYKTTLVLRKENF